MCPDVDFLQTTDAEFITVRDAEWITQTSTTIQDLINAKAKKVSWLFEVINAAGTVYHWSTKTIPVGSTAIVWDSGIQWDAGIHWDEEERGTAYQFKIMDFRGIELRRTREEMGLIAPSELSFLVSNKDNALTASAFIGGSVRLALYIQTETDSGVVKRWRFRIKKAEPGYQKFRLVCEDFLQKYLRGTYPNLRLLKDLFPSNDTDFESEVCIPVPIGQAYIPLKSVYCSSGITLSSSSISVVASSNAGRCALVDSRAQLGPFEVGRNLKTTSFFNAANNGTFLVLSASTGRIEITHDAGFVTHGVSTGGQQKLSQGTRYYVLGSTGFTYTISKVRSPRAWGKKSEWDSPAYAFNQSSITSPTTGKWRGFQAVIADVNNDGTPDAPGLWKQGDHFLDIPTQFSRSDSSGLTNPARAIEYVMKDMGLTQAELYLPSFLSAATTYDGWSLTFNGGFWQKKNRAEVLSSLLLQCHSYLLVGEGVELHTYSKTSQDTITKNDVIRETDVGEGTFQYRDIRPETIHDSGHIAWQEANEAQDEFIKTTVPTKSTKDSPSAEVLEVPFVANSVKAQTIGLLYYQRKYEKQAEVRFTGKSHLLGLHPGDVVTIEEADYGGSYNVLIDVMQIKPDLSIDFTCVKFAVALDDWNDITPSGLSIVSDDSLFAWESPLSGPLTGKDLGRASFEMWGKSYLIVGPSTNIGQYTNIQNALNDLGDKGHSGVILRNGTYNLSTALANNIYLPARDLEIVGETKEGVIVQTSTKGGNCFNILNRTNKYRFAQFTINDRSPSTSASKIIYGTSGSYDLLAEDMNINLTSSTAGGVSAKVGIQVANGHKGILTVKNSMIDKGMFAIYSEGSSHLRISNNILRDQVYYAVSMANTQNFNITSNQVTGFHRNGIGGGGAVSPRGIVADNIIISATGETQSSTATLTGLYLVSAKAVVSGNRIDLRSDHTNHKSEGIMAYGTTGMTISNNIINIKATTGQAAGIRLSAIKDSLINNNVIKFDISSTKFAHYGIWAGPFANGVPSSNIRNEIANNKIDGVNNKAIDIGINLSTGNSANGHAIHGNFTYRVGVRLNDGGSSNTETDYKDI